MSEIRDLEQAYTTLAKNEEWMAVHIDRIVQRRKRRDNRTALAKVRRAHFEVPGRGCAHALEYCADDTTTGAFRQRQHSHPR
jgi:hypothetical protein